MNTFIFLISVPLILSKYSICFLPFLNEPGAFGHSTQWDCNCDTTIHHEELNSKLPWDLFYSNIQEVLGPYLQEIGLKEEYKQQIENTKRAELAETKASIFNDFLSKLK